MLDARTVAACRAYVLEDEPAAEVAARLGITVNALRQIKYRVDRMIVAVRAEMKSGQARRGEIWYTMPR